MQLEDEIAKELADIVNERLVKFFIALDARLIAVETRDTDAEDYAPEDVTSDIAKAVALLAEAPPLTQAASGNPVVVNFSPANTGKKVKTITTRRDEAGNLVARVIED